MLHNRTTKNRRKYEKQDENNKHGRHGLGHTTALERPPVGLISKRLELHTCIVLLHSMHKILGTRLLSLQVCMHRIPGSICGASGCTNSTAVHMVGGGERGATWGGRVSLHKTGEHRRGSHSGHSAAAAAADSSIVHTADALEREEKKKKKKKGSKTADTMHVPGYLVNLHRISIPPPPGEEFASCRESRPSRA